MSLNIEEKLRKRNEYKLNKYNEKHKIINNIIYKKCSLHNIYFPNEDEFILMTEEYFYKNKSSSDMFNTYCKRCTVKKAIEYEYKHYDKLLESERKYYRDNPERRQNRRELSVKRRDAIAQWRRENPEKLKEYELKRMKKNHHISQKEWESCKKYFNYECAYCGLPIKKHIIKFKGKLRQGDFHREHVLYDGDNDLSNCVPSCKICNSEKHKAKLEDWYNENNPKFSKERLNKIYKWLNEDYKQYVVKKKYRKPYTYRK